MTRPPRPARPEDRNPKWFRAAVRDAIARGSLRPKHTHGDAVDHCRDAGFGDLLVAAGSVSTPAGAMLISEPRRSDLAPRQAWRRAAELGQAIGCTAWIEPRSWLDRRDRFRVCFSELQATSTGDAPQPQRIAPQPLRGRRGRSHTKQSQAVTGSVRGPAEGGQDGRQTPIPPPGGKGTVTTL